MKKLFRLFLVFVVCLGLVACGSGNSNDDSNGPTNNNTVDTSYVGTWKGYTHGNVSDDLMVSMVLTEDGKCVWTYEDGKTKDGAWEVSNDKLTAEFSDHSIFEFKIEEENGTIKLNWDNIYVLQLETENK